MKLCLLAALSMLSLAVGCQKSATQEEEWAEVAKTIPWSIQMLQSCVAYKALDNELNKKDIATNALNLIRKAEVKNARGNIEAVTPAGANRPDELILQITVGRDFRFNSQFDKRPVRRGDGIFERVSGLKPKQCVIFSAKNLESIAPYTSGKLCDPQFYAEFTKVEPCI